jgi:hypothetical protein
VPNLKLVTLTCNTGILAAEKLRLLLSEGKVGRKDAAQQIELAIMRYEDMVLSYGVGAPHVTAGGLTLPLWNSTLWKS